MSAQGGGRFYLNNISNRPPLHLLRFAVAIGKQPLSFDYVKQSAGEEDLTMVYYPLFKTEQRARLRVKLGGRLGRSFGPDDAYTLGERVFSIRGTQGGALPLFHARQDAVRPGEAFFIKMGDDLKPGQYRVTARLEKGSPGYLLFYRIRPVSISKGGCCVKYCNSVQRHLLCFLIAVATVFSSSPAWSQNLHALFKEAASGGRFAMPTHRELAEAQLLFESLLAGKKDTKAFCELLESLHMEMVPVQHEGIRLTVIRENPDRKRGRGLYVYNADAADSACLMAPHSFTDVLTGRIALKLVGMGGFTLTAFNTMKRYGADGTSSWIRTWPI